MTDYFPLIARAVDGLDTNTGEARRALYERARNALVTQLRSVEPALPETDITKERLALEDAIRKVEAEAARKSRVEAREPRTAPPPLQRDRPIAPADIGRSDVRRSAPAAPRLPTGTGVDARPPGPPPLSARERLLEARTSSRPRDGLKGFRDVVSEVHDLGAATAKSAQSARDTRDSYGPPTPPPFPPAEEAAARAARDFEPEVDAEDLRYADEQPDSSSAHGSYREFQREDAHPPQSALHQPYAATDDDEHYVRPPRSSRGLVTLVAIAVGIIILAGIGATVAWQWSNVTGLYQHYAHSGTKPPVQAPAAPASQPKFSGRVPQEQSAAPAPAPSTQGSQGTQGSQAAEPAVAQRVVLYEEDTNDPQGKRSVGSAIWRTETVSPGPGLAPELAVRADVEIPERHMTVTWSLRRNTDQALPASHTIEIMFKLPPDFPGGGIANVPGILMKQSEQARGTPLAGLAVKVTNGFFLVGLSAVEADVQRNIQLLKERPWFDIPIVYTSGGRAILAMEKGAPGDKAFAEAFAAWEKK
jgi:hypothetical protein